VPLSNRHVDAEGNRHPADSPNVGRRALGTFLNCRGLALPDERPANLYNLVKYVVYQGRYFLRYQAIRVTHHAHTRGTRGHLRVGAADCHLADELEPRSPDSTGAMRLVGTPPACYSGTRYRLTTRMSDFSMSQVVSVTPSVRN
jgi:hypothetical protein